MSHESHMAYGMSHGGGRGRPAAPGVRRRRWANAAQRRTQEVASPTDLDLYSSIHASLYSLHIDKAVITTRVAPFAFAAFRASQLMPFAVR